MFQKLTRRGFLGQTAAAPFLAHAARTSPSIEWPSYGNDPGCSRYSTLNQINKSNVSKLKPAWTFHCGDASQRRPQTTIECTPLIDDGVFYCTSPKLKVVALQAGTGKHLWTFDPFENPGPRGAFGVNRGVAYWKRGYQRRIFHCASTRLYCLDANTGKPVNTFGDEGIIDLTQGLGRDITGLSYQVTTPGVIYEDLLIIGSFVEEGPRPAAPGHIRAYNVKTGKQAWIFHTIPYPGEFGYETWPRDAWKTTGGVNDWGGLSLDTRRGIVYLALGSPAFDFFGGDRIGDGLFGNCVLALNAATGKRVWHFQTTHHDLWDYDLPCNPTLMTVSSGGRTRDAVAQVTKTGMVFLFDRETGKPLFDIQERPVAASDIDGEVASKTQPFPVKPAPFARHRFTEDMVWGVDEATRKQLLEQFHKMRSNGIYTPPSRQGTVLLPGFHGGACWSGACADPKGRLFVNSNEVPWIVTIVDAPKDAGFRYNVTGYVRYEDEDNFYPAVAPPWGTLNAIDMNTGDRIWTVPLGEYEDLKAKGIPQTGTENMGGAIVTAGGLVFIAATKDEKFRAFDADTGKVLWETKLEAGGYSTPCTYEAGGKQFVAIACGGGGKCRTKAGDAYVAFAVA